MTERAGTTALLLTCGLPGSGKTTLARRLATERGAVRLTKDDWLWELGASPWDGTTQERVERKLRELASDMLQLGCSVVLDFGLWTIAERDELRTAARSAAPPWDEEPITRSHLDRWVGMFERPSPSELALFDPRPGPEEGEQSEIVGPSY